MSDWRTKLGRPLTPAEVKAIKALVEKHLGAVEGTIAQSTVLSLMADERLRVAALQGVPLDALLAAASPETLAAAVEQYGLGPDQARALRYAAHNTGVYLSGFTSQAQASVVRAVNACQAAGMGAPEAAREMFNRFGALNRDWRTIAVTEAAMNHNNGFLMGRPTGSYVVGQSRPDCCAWCRAHVHGKVLRVAEPPSESDPARDWDNEIWVGKSNYGRHQHRYDKDHREREDHELWKPAVTQHPHCRCYFSALDPRFQYVDTAGRIQVKP